MGRGGNKSGEGTGGFTVEKEEEKLQVDEEIQIEKDEKEDKK